MCGIWGFFCERGWYTAEEKKRILCDLMILSQSRGKEASGITKMTDNKVLTIKMPKPASKLIKENSFKQLLFENHFNNEVYIGHSRLATNGSQYRPENNQPILSGDIVTVHNGIIVNDRELWEKYKDWEAKSELDSEIFVKLLDDKYQQGYTIEKAVEETYSELDGMASTITLFTDIEFAALCTNNGSLYYAVGEKGKTIIAASEKMTLRKMINKNWNLKKEFEKQTIHQVINSIFIDLKKMDIYSPEELQCLKWDEYAKIKKRRFHKYIESSCFTEKNIYYNPQRYSIFDVDIEPIRKLKRCTKCLLPETMPFIQFDDKNICNYCKTYKRQTYIGEDKLRQWAEKLKKHYKGRTDSIVAFSGGRDSSYGLHYFVKELGLKPIAYSYDWGMVTDLARRNQSRMCSKLGVEFIPVSANISKKRSHIKKNVEAWLKKPDLGMIPLFMAGDKHYFYYANKIKKEYQLDNILLASNPYEKTHFKSGFCGIEPAILRSDKDLELEQLPVRDILKMGKYYVEQFLGNRDYINSSLIDTAGAACSYYIIPHQYFRLFHYIPWEERRINQVLIEEYDWEKAKDTESTWRIGDGTAPFYNYIYYTVCGFTENDTLRSNQIREGMITREEGLELIYRDNKPRFESMKWYFDTIHVPMEDALKVINQIKKQYEV